MNFFSQETPETVVPVLGVAMVTLALAFSVTVTGASFATVAGSFGPAKEMLAINGQVLTAAWEGTEEAVYATAVATGIIPYEESSYYAVDLPFHRPRVTPQVAGAYTELVEEEVLLPEALEKVDVLRLPWQVIYRIFGGSQ